ncbi:hypothetical protein [Deinococcus sp.]|uniref:hypothetical protein n=1 Tax=Deinococcus sp. TaxID=47478 RepID=UPI0028698F5E|nr:hypothetical protein [Deinococcus sp.]
MTPTTLADGLGPVTVRRYWRDVQGARRPPEAVVTWVVDHFQEVMPRPLAFVWKTAGAAGQARVGDCFFLILLVRRAWVRLAVLEPHRFRNATLRHHPESGWVEFRAVPHRSGSYRLEIESQARSSTWMDRLAYLLGNSAVQRATWEIVLNRAVAFSGGAATIRGHHTTEHAFLPSETDATRRAAP